MAIACRLRSVLLFVHMLPHLCFISFYFVIPHLTCVAMSPEYRIINMNMIRALATCYIWDLRYYMERHCESDKTKLMKALIKQCLKKSQCVSIYSLSSLSLSPSVRRTVCARAACRLLSASLEHSLLERACLDALHRSPGR